jgi:hypothetical protein
VGGHEGSRHLSALYVEESREARDRSRIGFDDASEVSRVEAVEHVLLLSILTDARVGKGDGGRRVEAGRGRQVWEYEGAADLFWRSVRLVG